MKNRLRLIFYPIFFSLLIYIFIEPFWIEEKTIIYRHTDIPASFSGMKIVFLTDIHHGPFFSIDRVRSLVDRVNALHPDIIILGGDFVHHGSEYIESCFKELARLSAPMGVFGVLGNHDHWENAALTRKEMEKAGIKDLDNDAVWLNRGKERIKLGGVGDFLEDDQDTSKTTDDVSSSDFVMLASHNPDFAEVAPVKIDLILSGHTHGGQVTLLGLWAPILNSMYGQKYLTGIVKNGSTDVIISNGIGTITPPVRFFARPQIVIIELQKK
ncbi:MAG TPA: metallophosphoesterase [bacterium]|nr:metallophosphoesterase [bacterium]